MKNGALLYEFLSSNFVHMLKRFFDVIIFTGDA